MARGRKPSGRKTVRFEVHIEQSIAAKFNEEFEDIFTGGIKRGARSARVEELIRKYLESKDV